MTQNDRDDTETPEVLDPDAAAALGYEEPPPGSSPLTTEQMLFDLQSHFATMVRHVRKNRELIIELKKSVEKLIRVTRPLLLPENRDPEELVGMKDVAKILNISERTAYRYVERGLIKAVRVGPRMVKVAKAELQGLTHRAWSPEGK